MRRVLDNLRERVISPNFPRAAVYALIACLSLSVASYVAVARTADDDRQRVFLLGDSFTGNYRFDPGDRLQDLIEEDLGREWQVFNLARPGGRALDVRLQLDEGETLFGRPDRVVLPWMVFKFHVDGDYIRLDKRGDSLKWLRVDERSLPVVETFDAELAKKTAIHKLGLLVGFWDLLEHLHAEKVQYPQERAEMRKDDPERRRRINAKIGEDAAFWATTDFDEARFVDSPAARDLDLLVRAAAGDDIPLLIVILPVGDMGAVREQFSPEAQARLERARVAMRGWCEDRGVDYVDLVDAFASADYDDFRHLDGVAGNRIVAEAAAEWVRGVTVPR